MAAERVHPHHSPSHHPREDHDQDQDQDQLSTPRPSPPSPEKPIPQPPAGTYVIQIPKDQIYRLPPPENADRLKRLSRPKSSRTCRCCRFFCFTLLTLILLLAIASGIFYLVFRPESPHYSINSISIKPLNLSSSSSRISPQFNISVTANNPNNHIGIYYEKDSSVEAYYQDVILCDGVLPWFYQPKNNVTVFNVDLKGSAIQLTSSVHKQLVAAEKSGTVALKVNLRAPVKIKVGSVKTWTIKVKINCDLTVDKLTSQSKILSKDCDYGVELW
ncbi:NDR1/HIN1-like protein 13 [Pistacia vera]|uniref:NDR1/HIN1-like protein 13 n=1 Tax=Pistacia vera TaxID=55513 RepID=UPI0012632BFE|nr:NDR1/HIN1-like protein 13 [Pistacia vera]